MSNGAKTFRLREALLRPLSVNALSARDLSGLISEARVSRLLASLALVLESAGVLDKLAPEARRHFHSAIRVYDKQRRDLRYDCESLHDALQSVGEKLVILKGGAYLSADYEMSRGRLITDIDIIVPAKSLTQAESALNQSGWDSSELDPYNEDYYRKWSHETPALINPKRGTTLDLHHSILPPTAGPNIDAQLLFDAVQEVQPGIFTLSLQDMVIHSATHLFHEGEFHHGLRDVWDLDRMLREFPKRDATFWDGLIDRAKQLELLTPLLHALRYSHLIFETPIAPTVLTITESWNTQLHRPLMDFLFLRAFRPNHPACRLPFTGVALNLLYIRSHYLRMPLYLLLPHLVRKAWMRRQSTKGDIPDKA